MVSACAIETTSPGADPEKKFEGGPESTFCRESIQKNVQHYKFAKAWPKGGSPDPVLDGPTPSVSPCSLQGPKYTRFLVTQELIMMEGGGDSGDPDPGNNS